MAWSFSLVLHLGFLPSFSLSIVGFLILGYHSSVQFSVAQSGLIFATPQTAAHFRTLPKRMSTESVMPSNHLILCHPLLLPPSVFPSIMFFQMSQVIASGGQSTGVSAPLFPMNIQYWFPLGRTGWISLQSKGLSRVFPNTTVQKHQFFGAQLSSQSNSHIHTWPLEKP